MSFLNDAEKFGKEDDEETDGNDGGDHEFLSFTQLHDVSDIQLIWLSVTSAILLYENGLTSYDLGLKAFKQKGKREDVR